MGIGHTHEEAAEGHGCPVSRDRCGIWGDLPDSSLPPRLVHLVDWRRADFGWARLVDGVTDEWLSLEYASAIAPVVAQCPFEWAESGPIQE